MGSVGTKLFGSKDPFLDLSEAPEELLVEVLLRLNSRDLVKNCCLVSKQWNKILSQKNFWIQKCQYEGTEYCLPPKEFRHFSLDYKRLYIKQPFGRNLIRDEKKKTPFSNMLSRYIATGPPGNGFDKRWKWNKSSGFVLEDPPVFMTEHRDEEFDNVQIDCCVATSHFWSSKEIMIDLIAEGFESYILDTLRPAITVSEYVAHRADCAAAYSMQVWLLPEDVREWRFYNETLNPTFEKRVTFQQWDNQKWVKIEHEFAEYGPGLRYIVLKSSGKDLQFWSGNYGAKMADPGIVVHYKFSNL